MNNKITILVLLVITGICSSCSTPKLTVNNKYAPTEHIDSILVVDVNNPNLHTAEEIGCIEIGQLDFSWKQHGLENCGYHEILSLAKSNAAQIGGHMICITEHKLPTNSGSRCHRIEAKIYRRN